MVLGARFGTSCFILKGFFSCVILWFTYGVFLHLRLLIRFTCPSLTGLLIVCLNIWVSALAFLHPVCTSVTVSYFMDYGVDLCSCKLMQMKSKEKNSVACITSQRSTVQIIVFNSSLSFMCHKRTKQRQNLAFSLSFYMIKDDVVGNKASQGCWMATVVITLLK